METQTIVIIIVVNLFGPPEIPRPEMMRMVKKVPI